MAEPKQYFEYLKQRSWRAVLYRNLYLYPRICFHIKGRTLDVGCGIGDMLQFRRETIGADVNPHLVEYCTKKGLDARLIQDGHLPFDTETFESAILDNVLEHIDSPMGILGEIYRVLQSEGRLIVGVPGEKGYQRDPDHKIFYDEVKLVETLTNARFKKMTVFHTPIKSSWMNQNISPYCVFGVFIKT
jgi:SAM-dependent methyltransferase